MAAGVGSTEANPFVLCGLRRWPLSRRSRRPLWTGKRAFFYFVWEFVCHTLGRCMPVAAMLTHVAIVWMGASVPGKGPSLYARDAAQKPHWCHHSFRWGIFASILTQKNPLKRPWAFLRVL